MKWKNGSFLLLSNSSFIRRVLSGRRERYVLFLSLLLTKRGKRMPFLSAKNSSPAGKSFAPTIGERILPFSSSFFKNKHEEERTFPYPSPVLRWISVFKRVSLRNRRRVSGEQREVLRYVSHKSLLLHCKRRDSCKSKPSLEPDAVATAVCSAEEIQLLCTNYNTSVVGHEYFN